MQIVKVDSSKLFRAFLDVPKHIYTDDPEYVPHIRQEIQRILWDNKMHNEVGLWLLFNNNLAVGRIAAFVNKGNKGGLGFFECVNNQEGAHQLFDIGIQWLQSKGLPIVEAPVNCGERDKFWGLMVKGFKKPKQSMKKRLCYINILKNTPILPRKSLVVPLNSLTYP